MSEGIAVVVAILYMLGALAALYGVMVMAVGSGTWFFVVWFVLAGVLVAAAGIAQMHVWDATPAVLRHGIRVVLGVCAVVLVLTQSCALSSFGEQGEDGLDFIIVLGAQVREDGPSAVLAYRLDTAYDYLQANPNTRCIVSGGQGFNEPAPEAKVMAEYLRHRGVDADRILIEDRSLTTYQNIRNSMRLFNASEAHVGIVTNNFHVFRGVHIARKQDIGHVCGIAAESNSWYLPNNLLRESFGITKDFLKGNL